MAFDGIVTKAIAAELQNLSGSKIDKIFEPNKNTIVFGLYFSGAHYLLNICIDSQNYRINLTKHTKPNPKTAPNFCMLLRKHLIGMYIKNITTNNLERLVIIDLEGLDDFGDFISKKLVVELMGKHCNIILLDDQNIIIDSLRHINNDNTLRSIIPHNKYIFPTTSKYNFLDCLTFEDFYNKLSSKEISDVFNGISKSFITESMKYLNIDNLNYDNLKKLYYYIKNIINRIDGDLLSFSIVETKKKDYVLKEAISQNDNPFYLNFFLDDFYYDKETRRRI